MTPSRRAPLVTEPLRLITLGRVELRDPAATGVVAGAMQPLRLALLAWLAVEDGGRFHRRDLVTALFWPEATTERARHALRQTIYALRQAAGDGLVVSRGQEEVGLGEQVLWCDATAFLTLLAEGQLERALELYSGDFLAGFHPGGVAPEFEHWVSETRKSLRSHAIAAATTLATRCRERGDLPAAVRWLRFAVGADPLREKIQQSLIRTLGQLGDHDGAREAHAVFAERLRRDLEREPAAETTALLNQPPRPQEQEHTEPVEPPVLSPTTTPRRRLHWQAAALAVLVLAGAGFLFQRHRGSAASEPLIAVAGFQWSGGTDSTAGPILADLLSTSLARIPGVQVLSGPRLLELEEHQGQLPPAARALRAAAAGGATLLVQGQISGNGSGRRVDLQLIELGTGRIRHTVRASAGDLLALADSAASALAGWFNAPAPPAPATAATTRSLVAYRFYEEGLRAFYNGDASAALQLLQEALAEDSNFAMAAYYGAEAARQQGDGPLMGRLQQRMGQLAPGLPDRERLLLLTSLAMAEVDPRSTVLADSLVDRWPGDPDAELMRAMAYGMFSADQREALASARRAIELDMINPRQDRVPCRICDGYRQLVLSQIAVNDFSGAERSAREFIARQPAQPTAYGMLSGVLSRLGRSEEAARQAAIGDSLLGRYPKPIMDGLIRAGEFEVADPELERWASSGVASVRENGRWWLTISLRTQGRLREALRLQREGVTPAGHVMPAREKADPTLLAVLLCEAGAASEGAALFASRARLEPGAPASQRFHQARQASWILTHVATCHALAGDTAALEPLADSIQHLAVRTGSPRHVPLYHYVRGLLLRARGDWAGALEQQQQATSSPVEGLTRINYELAGALLAQGRAADAIAPLQAGLRGPLEAGGLYLSRTELEERLAQAFERAGERDSARVHYGLVAAAWRKADPGFKARYAYARRQAGL